MKELINFANLNLLKVWYSLFKILLLIMKLTSFFKFKQYSYISENNTYPSKIAHFLGLD